MKRIICLIAAMMLAVIPLSACESADADSESQVSDSTSDTSSDSSTAPEIAVNKYFIPRDEAIEIMNGFFERRSNVTLHFMNTADIEVDKKHTIPDNSDYVLVTDEALKDCHSIEDLKAYVETAYTNNYAEKHLYPAYLYEGDDGKPRFMEYNGNLYLNEKTASRERLRKEVLSLRLL